MVRPVFVAPVHRCAPQGLPVSAAAVLPEDAEVLRQEADGPGGVGHGLHWTDGAGHPALVEHGEDRAGVPGLHLLVREREPVRGHGVGEVPEAGPRRQLVELVDRDRESGRRAGPGGEVPELHADSTVGERPAGFDKEMYKRRNEVERTINRLKHSRAVAAWYDKRAYVFHGTVTVASIRLWLRP